MKLSYLDLTTTDPDVNLATEQYVFDSLPRDRAWFMLWQNDNAIIIGKHQNTFAEINEPYVREHGIRVVRRLSGGGAVYHDLGNLNFTFITDAGETDKLDFRAFCLPIVDTLESLGVPAEINGRNDITIEGKKFSGNSQYLKSGRVMHHGTILFDSDLGVVSHALRVDESKLQTKGIRSVRSRVTNVKPYLPREMTLSDFRRVLLDHILAQMPGEAWTLTEEDRAAIEELRAQRYGTYDWNYGVSPQCTVRKSRRVEGCGRVDAYLTIEEGVIRSLTFHGDFFSVDDPEELAKRFLGRRPAPEEYAAALDGVDAGRFFVGLDNETLLDLLTE
jgi:lipoate-protein ligase A